VRVKFLEQPEDVRVAVGDSALLRCVATTAVNDCQWTWRPLSEPNKTEVIVKQFPAFGNYSRDCSVRFRSVLKEQEGLWGCTILGPPNYTLLAAPPAKLTVFEPGTFFLMYSFFVVIDCHVKNVQVLHSYEFRCW
jgi:hypothetical protein